MTDGPKFLPTQSVAQGRDWAMMCLTAIEKYIYLAASLNGEKRHFHSRPGKPGELFGIEKGGRRSKDRKTRSLNECREVGQPDVSTINARFGVSVARKNPVSATVES
jgi:hypothetical protein